MEKDPARAATYLERNQGLIAIAPVLNSQLEQLNDLRRVRTLVEQGTDEMLGIDGKERRSLIDELRCYDNEVVSNVRQLEKQLREMQ